MVIIGSLLFLGSTAAKAEARVALVIGNDHYANLDKDRQLQKAGNDAKAVGDALEADGFTVLRGFDLTRAQIVDKVYELSTKLHAGDTALFYFAGHGVALGNGNYLLPSDVPDIDQGQELRLANQSVAESDIIATLQDKGARVAIMILDACRDNPFRRPGLRSVGSQRGLGHLPEVNGIFTLYSAGYGQSALDRLSDADANPNSVFTRVLVPMLTRPGLNLDDLAFDVRETVATLAATTPDHHLQVPAAYNQIIGGRVFLVPPAETPPQASAISAAPVQPSASLPVVAATIPEPPPGPVSPAPDPLAIAASVEMELNRLGCDAGPINGAWTSRSRAAMLRLARVRDLAVNVDKPDKPTLDTLRGLAAPGCPVEFRVQTQAVHRPAPVGHATGPRAERHIAQQMDSRRIERSVAGHSATAKASAGSRCFEFNGQRVCD